MLGCQAWPHTQPGFYHPELLFFWGPLIKKNKYLALQQNPWQYDLAVSHLIVLMILDDIAVILFQEVLWK